MKFESSDGLGKKNNNSGATNSNCLTTTDFPEISIIVNRAENEISGTRLAILRFDVDDKLFFAEGPAHNGGNFPAVKIIGGIVTSIFLPCSRCGSGNVR